MTALLERINLCECSISKYPLILLVTSLPVRGGEGDICPKMSPPQSTPAQFPYN